MRVFRAAFIAVALCVVARGLAAQRSDFVIVVHADNPVDELTREAASRLFLKKTDSWPNGNTVVPLDLVEDSQTREAFSTAVHKRSIGAIKAFWQQQLFAARGIPPLEAATETEVLAKIRADPNAIGYVADGTTLGADVKIVRVRF